MIADPLVGMTLAALQAEHARCVAGGWAIEAARIAAEIERRKAVGS